MYVFLGVNKWDLTKHGLGHMQIKCQTRFRYYNVKTRLVDLVVLFWLKQNLVDTVGVLLIKIGLGFDNLFSALLYHFPLLQKSSILD